MNPLSQARLISVAAILLFLVGGGQPPMGPASSIAASPATLAVVPSGRRPAL
jgi:hypothetical protein